MTFFLPNRNAKCMLILLCSPERQCNASYDPPLYALPQLVDEYIYRLHVVRVKAAFRLVFGRHV